MRRVISTFIACIWTILVFGQINTNHVMHTGRSLLYFGNYTAAIENFNMIIKTQPHLPEPYFYRGAAKLNLDDYRGSLTDLNKAIEIKPFYPDAYLYRGMVNYNLKNYEAAMDDYSTAMNMDGENADVFNNRGICKAAMRDFQGAVDDYSKAIEIKSKNYNAYLNRSIAYQMLEMWDKSIADCNQLIRMRPNSPMGYLCRGLVKNEKEDYAGAMRDFDMAIYIDPKNAYAYQNRGMIKQQLGNYETAIMDYDKAIEIDPSMASAYFNRGIAKEMLGRNGARQDYNMASSLDPRFEKRPWLTSDEQEDAQKRYWASQAKTSSKNDEKIDDTSVDSTSNSSTNTITIDPDDLRRRRLKANLVAAESREIPGSGNSYRDKHRVQNHDINIDLFHNFSIEILDKKSADEQKVGYFDMTMESLNAANNYNPFLTISCKKEISNEEIVTYKNQILLFDERIRTNKDVVSNYLYRGIFKAAISDYNGALADFDKAISIDERCLLAYFMRANTRQDMVQAIEAVSQSGQNNNSDGLKGRQSFFQPKRITDVAANDDIMTDYSVVLYMNPNFFFAYYNRGNIYCNEEKFGQAIEEYSKAISLEPDFAEAYFNRGLIKVLINDIKGGADDLSRAGELGIEQAYMVIKRYCNE